jgi:primary-amine oxidase
MELEIRLTGVLLVYVAGTDEPNPFGTTVAPNINAHHHQHIFSIRVDPMIDGLYNSVMETDIVPLPDAPTGSSANFAGNAFLTQERVLKSQREGARDYESTLDRRWSIVNSAKKHYSSGKEVGYSVNIQGAARLLLGRADGWAGRRAAFATKALWVVKDVEDKRGSSRMWPAGRYVPQSRGELEDSVGKWISEEGSIENEDILMYITIGTPPDATLKCIA